MHRAAPGSAPAGPVHAQHVAGIAAGSLAGHAAGGCRQCPARVAGQQARAALHPANAEPRAQAAELCGGRVRRQPPQQSCSQAHAPGAPCTAKAGRASGAGRAAADRRCDLLYRNTSRTLVPSPWAGTHLGRQAAAGTRRGLAAAGTHRQGVGGQLLGGVQRHALTHQDLVPGSDACEGRQGLLHGLQPAPRRDQALAAAGARACRVPCAGRTRWQAGPAAPGSCRCGQRR